MMRESKIEDYLVQQAAKKWGEVRKVKWIGRRNAPDRLVLIQVTYVKPLVIKFIPRAIWVELKATGVKPSEAQLREHERMRSYGLDVRVIDSYEGVDALWQPDPPR